MEVANTEQMRAARVLVVDDERHIARFLEFVLKKAGYEVVVAHDGQQALAQVEQFAPDAVLLDLVMPNLSGLEVLQRLRAEDKYAGLFIAVLSARSFEDMSGEILKDGANLHCEKPVAPSSLLSQLSEFGITPLVTDGARSTTVNEVTHEVA
jgi:DNA-binding response OmpR family regulator